VYHATISKPLTPEILMNSLGADNVHELKAGFGGRIDRQGSTIASPCSGRDEAGIERRQGVSCQTPGT